LGVSDFWITGKGLDDKSQKRTGTVHMASMSPSVCCNAQECYLHDKDERNAYKLAVVLNAVARVVDIVHGKKKFKVHFASDKIVTDLSKNIITLSAEPVLNPPSGFSFSDSIDVITGMALHEAAHARFSSEEFYKEIPGNPFIGAVRNLAEDIYVENLTTLLYPGYRQYFIKYRYYQYDLGKKHPPDIYFENSMHYELNKRTMDLILTFRSTINYQSDSKRVQKAAEMMRKLLFVNDFDRLIKVNVRQVALNVYNWLVGNIVQHDIAYVKSVDIIERYNEENQPDKNKQTISDDLQQMVNSIREEEVQVINTGDISKSAGLGENALPPVIVTFRKPKITKDAVRLYNKSKTDVNQYIIRLKNQLSWANTKQVINTYALPNGDLDQDALYASAFSNRVFKQTEIIDTCTRKLDIALLIDCSSSMISKVDENKTRLELARNIAVLFVEAMEAVDSVNTWVFGFSQNMSTDITELYSPKDLRKHRIGAIKADGTTPEGSALKYCSAKLFFEGRPFVPKVFIVLADGNPNPGRESKMVKEQVRRITNMGFRLIHIAISDRAVPYGYKHSISWSDYYTIVKQFSKMLKQLL